MIAERTNVWKPFEFAAARVAVQAFGSSNRRKTAVSKTAVSMGEAIVPNAIPQNEPDKEAVLSLEIAGNRKVEERKIRDRKVGG